MLKGKKILLGITGSIAAYKSAVLVRLLVKEGAEVQVILTPAAAEFVTPLTLSTLSGKAALINLSEKDQWNEHVKLGLEADLMIIAPATANTLGKMAHGICDNLLLATYLSAKCDVMIAPAMDEDMWQHASTQGNIQKLISFGNQIIPVESGELASGLIGAGRMSEPEQILEYIKKKTEQSAQLQGKIILITSGGTRESIDPVRYIGNRSTGKMGAALAEAACARGAKVIYISPSHAIQPLGRDIEIIHTETAEEMYQVTTARFAETHIAILAAAVADFKPEAPANQKIKKNTGTPEINLIPTKDILAELGQRKAEQILVGFALETENEIENAKSKIDRKNLDFIVLNSLNDSGAGFEKDTNKISIIDKKHNSYPFELKSKKAVAEDILNTIHEIAG